MPCGWIGEEMKRVFPGVGCALAALLAVGPALAGDMSVISGGTTNSPGTFTTDADSLITGAAGGEGTYEVSSGDVVTNDSPYTVRVQDTGAGNENGNLAVYGTFINAGAVIVSDNGAGGGVVVLNTSSSRIENSASFTFGEGSSFWMGNGGALFTNHTNGVLNIHAGTLTPGGDFLEQVRNDGTVNLSGTSLTNNLTLDAASTGTVNTGTVADFEAVDVGAGKLNVQAFSSFFSGDVKSTSAAADAITVSNLTQFRGKVTGNVKVDDASVSFQGDHVGSLTMADGFAGYYYGASFSGVSNVTGGTVRVMGSSGPGEHSTFSHTSATFSIPQGVSFELANEYSTLQADSATSITVDGSVIGSGLFYGDNTLTDITISGLVGSDDSGCLAVEGKTLAWQAGSTIQIGHDGTEITFINTNAADVTIDRDANLKMTAALVSKFQSDGNYKDLFMEGTGTYTVNWDAAGSADEYTVTNGAGTFIVSKRLDEDGDPELWVRLKSANAVSSDPIVNHISGDANKDMSGVIALSGLTGAVRAVGAMTPAEIAALPTAGGQANAHTLQYFTGGNGAGSLAPKQMESAVTSYTGLSPTLANEVSMSTVSASLGNVQGRLATVRNQYAQAYNSLGSDTSLASAIMNCDFRNRVWVSGFGLWEELDEKNGVPGYKYSSGGVMAGYDRVFGPITVGASFGWTGGSFKDHSALANDSDIDSYAFNLYGTYVAPNGFFASLFGGYVYSDYDMKKLRGGFDNLNNPVNGWERSDYHGNSWSIGGVFGYDFKPTQCLTLTPSVGLTYQRSRSNSFDAVFDWGGGSSTLRNSNIKNHSVSLPVALNAEYRVIDNGHSALALSGNVGYAYEFHNKGASGALSMGGLNAPRIDFRGRNPGRNTWNLGAGVKYDHGRFEVAAKYDYYARSKYDAHRVMGTVAVNF